MTAPPFTLKDFNLIISLGDNCAPALALRDLGLHHETFPYDWVRSTAQIVHDSLEDDFADYTTFGKYQGGEYFLHDLYRTDYPKFPSSHINNYGQYFTHYLDYPPDKLTESLLRRAERLKVCLGSDKKILFIRSTESYLYDKKSRERADLYWDYLKKISSLLEKRYPRLDFAILNIEANKVREPEGRVYHFSLTFPHEPADVFKNKVHAPYYMRYRNEIYRALKWIKA